jgi:hypothetical protein
LPHISVEEYPKGCPRFSAFAAAHDLFRVYRRFSGVRSRLLLLTHDEITQLEAKLNRIDEKEVRPLWLSGSRIGMNPERAAVVSALRSALRSYGELYVKAFSVIPVIANVTCLKTRSCIEVV